MHPGARTVPDQAGVEQAPGAAPWRQGAGISTGEMDAAPARAAAASCASR
jgi:hypothetical protein